jgi:hypothetical protein
MCRSRDSPPCRERCWSSDQSGAVWQLWHCLPARPAGLSPYSDQCRKRTPKTAPWQEAQ